MRAFLAGRTLTLPLFVSTLVPTFYGGVLGIGEFTWQHTWFERVAREPLVCGILGLYLAAFAVYSWLLRIAPVGPSYAAMHGHVVTVLLISIVFLGERISLVQGIGCLLIMAGIVVLAITERLEH